LAPTDTPTAGPEAPPLSLAEHTCLALVDEGPRHGWALVRELSPDGDIGRLWHLSRPLTYRAIDGLVDKGLVARHEPPARRARERVLLSSTSAGQSTSRAWLDVPVAHLRDVRTELLVKLRLRERAGLGVVALLEAQRDEFAPRIEHLVERRAGDVADLWRRESARAVRRFLDLALEAQQAAGSPPARSSPRRLSARNQLAATVGDVRHGDVMSTITVSLADGQQITAVITSESTDDLGLAPGDQVTVVVKSTDAMLAKD
jgi:PadR family transcriptional regulator AphA